jgi:nucleoside phosphorylase
MDISEIYILVWDDKENFYSPDTQRQFGSGKLYKDVIPFHSEEEFAELLNKLGSDDKFIVCCHVNYKDLSGYLEFRNTRIAKKYGIDNVIYLSSGESMEVVQKISEKTTRIEAVYLYSVLMDKLEMGEIKIHSKLTLTSPESVEYIGPAKHSSILPKVDYAILTAMFEYEFEELKHFINFPENEIIRTETIEYHVGYLKNKREIKVIAGIPRATGMVDAAILASLMVEIFKPKFLLMSGVCGGISSLNFGDIVVGKQIFMFQKGKISDGVEAQDSEGNKRLEIFDEDGKVVDMSRLFDFNGKQVSVSIEKFEIEQDSIIDLNPLVDSKIERRREEAETVINKEIAAFGNEISIVMAPIACSTMVINKRGYFEDWIKPIHRKTVAVEMESYGVARACKFANNGKTIPIIFKSIMDNMKEKTDTAKRLAANTSARFMVYLLTNILSA